MKVTDFVKVPKRCRNLWRSAAPEWRTVTFSRNTHDNENHGHVRLQSRAKSCLETKDWCSAEGRDISKQAIQRQVKGRGTVLCSERAAKFPLHLSVGPSGRAV